LGSEEPLAEAFKPYSSGWLAAGRSAWCLVVVDGDMLIYLFAQLLVDVEIGRVVYCGQLPCVSLAEQAVHGALAAGFPALGRKG
jgi:hypothetical protein